MTEVHRITNSFTDGAVLRPIWQLSWPMMLIMVFNFLVGFTDIYVAGLISPSVQAAVGFVSQLYFLLIIIANAISTGSVALVSRNIGANDARAAVHHARQSLIIGFFCALGLTAAVLIFYRQIVAFVGFPEPVRDIAQTFLRIFAFALGPNYLLIITNGIFRASGEVKKPLFTMCAVCLVNIVLDFLLVFGYFRFPHMGYAGIAVATSVSLTLGMLLNLIFFASYRWKNIFALPWTPSPETMRLIISLGWPAALLQIAWNAGSIILYNILGRLGEHSIIALASITNGLRIEAIIFLPAFALNMTAAVLVGQNLGAGKPDHAAQLGWRISLSGAALFSLIAAVIFFMAEPCAALLSKDLPVVAETARYLKLNMLAEPFMALSMILGGGLQGAGDMRGSMMVIIIGMWFIRLPLAVVLGLLLGYGALGVWIAMVISMIVQGMLMSVRFYRGKWKGISFGNTPTT